MIGGWGGPPTVLANMCEFMQIHIKPELFKLVNTLREKNLKNIKSIELYSDRHDVDFL